MGFFYSFLMALLLSMVQAAALVLLYVLFQTIVKNKHAHQNTQLLYSLIIIQLLSTALTFYCLYTQQAFTEISLETLGISHQAQTWVQQSAPWLVSLYCIVVLFKMVQISVKWRQFQQNVHQQLTKPPVAIRLFTQLKSLELGILPKVQVWLSNHIITPITYGFLKPVIVLPIALLNQLSTQEVESIIVHELTHIKNNDYIFNWMLIVVETLFCFNPFVQFLINKIKLERELQCDTQVIHFKYDAVDYAQTLLKIATYQTATPSFQLKAVQHSQQLLQRIQFFNNSRYVNAAPKRRLYVLPVLAFTVLCSLSVVQFFEKETLIENLWVAPSPINNPELVNNNSAEYKRAVTLPTSPTTNTLASKQTQTSIKKAISKNAEMVALTNANENFIPVALNETPDSSKLFIYDIETPKGKVKQVYQLTLVQGVWQYKNIVTVFETAPDSVMKVKLDTIKTTVTAFQ
ncbi:M56 family metallopeptidase [Ferruginibacter yonginensis]|uniref:M56 family metallopeptidase n=1 Tax=Ferruginibacter yonginensis TaxID=1310416 RepID=A0ABV8QNV5_9BACT